MRAKNNHVQDVCADRHKISMHAVPLTPAPEGLFGGNLIAASFFFFSPPSPNICRRGIKQKVGLVIVEEFSSRPICWTCQSTWCLLIFEGHYI